jgi:drug/metabolite transporter (DMT)-like permease
MTAPARGVWAALGVIYFVWGSTYLAIKIAVDTLPPLLTAGTRFLAAGAILALVLAARGRSLRITRRELRGAAVAGTLLLALGVGVVHVAETRIDSSVAAMIAGSVPLQVVVWRTMARERVIQATRVAAAAGIVGLALIVVPQGSSGGSTAVGLAFSLTASVSWSVGSFVSRRMTLPADPFVATVYERLHQDAFAAPQLLAWAYLATMGSLVAFTAYAWLLRHLPISQVVTHQYVNPVVAVVLGALLLGERLRPTTLIGAGIVIGAVFVTVRNEGRPPPARRVREPDAAPAAAESG